MSNSHRMSWSTTRQPVIRSTATEVAAEFFELAANWIVRFSHAPNTATNAGNALHSQRTKRKQACSVGSSGACALHIIAAAANGLLGGPSATMHRKAKLSKEEKNLPPAGDRAGVQTTTREEAPASGCHISDCRVHRGPRAHALWSCGMFVLQEVNRCKVQGGLIRLFCC